MENFDIVCSEITDYVINNKKQISEKYLIKYLAICSFDWSSYNMKSHKHHVLPKALFPDYIKDCNNIALLPIKIHLLAHKFLNLGIKNDIKLLRAVLILEKFYGKRFDLETYEKMRKISNENASKRMKGNGNCVFKALANGTHNVQTQLKEGKHPFQGKNSPVHKALLDGTHVSFRPPWQAPTSNDKTTKIFSLAEEVYEIYKKEEDPKYWSFTTKCNKILHEEISVKSMPSLLRKFESGWIPNEDEEWKKWKEKIK